MQKCIVLHFAALQADSMIIILSETSHSGPPTRGGKWGNFPWAPPCLGPLLHYQKKSKYSSRTVTLITTIRKYSVDNYTGINCWNCSHIQSQRSNSQKFPAIREFLYNKYCDYTAEMTTLNSISEVYIILKIIQQSERYIAINYKLTEITLKFNLRV